MTDGADPATAPAPPRTMHVARSFGTLVEVAHLHLVAMVVMVVAMTLVACIASFFTRPPGTGSFSRAD